MVLLRYAQACRLDWLSSSSLLMREFQKKRRIREALYSWPVIILLAGIFLLLANATWGAYQKAHIAFVNKEKVSNELADLKEREGELTEKIGHLQSDFGIEAEIRERFGVAREGEEVVVIVPSVQDDRVASNNALKKSFWAAIIGFVTRD
ncbi:MAG: hypothetical protein COZ49_01665 [Candidatus Yonathbacteria bacterium CG_4_10_14_3_um_filter_47_65]|uniref:Septum formation initiator n=2 Tax=Parcubacteria group TaxID=1794811 RepID=A0A2M8D870_9BACT|nr:MAG: hypothetical protein AUJ44_01050 [Candidatus Nomurabacteria bacterium CG1_02_47_685]PIP04124.1 MAG: hypothetical protein COX54_00720 [Candidatus Yonathbacteria bacterium CG23_combo_of_CG06-09_8_20_14_all_46_18]PIQ31257.1 MAG: hypothetical protein COW61_03970 [Candidatus Yonathbacteria bacterium CG17_big_fil_post_rev_8_21_14_2_50_46_19]PIX56510.1 MAG: hypothetical protein COZ49_01665 [Candidatus Yonathbacteria bacterium CG_4_10_14_3_um_filter_47_65]PIY57762.1 MAG: hypothetical protein CO